MYIAGYAIECLIKAKLMEMFGKENLEELEPVLRHRKLIPEDASLFDHRIELYLRASGRMSALKDNKAVWQSFNISNEWRPSWRYDPSLSNQADAEDFLAAVDLLLEWISKNIWLAEVHRWRMPL